MQMENDINMLKAQVEELKFSLEWSIEVIGDNLGLDDQGTPKHDCSFLSNPEAGCCNFHEEYWNAKALIKEANEEEIEE